MTTTPQPPTDALLPCPFCGGEPEIFTGAYKSRRLPYGVRARVVCEKCNIERSQAHSGGDTEQATKWAIDRWNHRTTPTTREVLEDFKHKVLDEVWEFWGDSRTARKIEQIIAKQLEKAGLGKGRE